MKLKTSILKYIGRLYRFYLGSKIFRFAVWFFVFLWILFSRSLLSFFVRLFIVLVYRHFFIFPVRHSKVVNTVVGPPGSGKTSLAAFVALKSSYLGLPVYSNADIIGTYAFDYETDYGTYRMDNSICILDESGLDLDNRSFTFNFVDVYDKKTGSLIHNGKSKLLSWKYHRHLGQTWWVLSQWTDQDAKIRNLSQNFYVCKKTGFHWLLCIKLYDTDIDVDPMSGDFRFIRKKLHTYFIFSPVIWFDFATDQVPFDLPKKNWSVVGSD